MAAGTGAAGVGSSVTYVGLEKILKKLDDKVLTKPVLREVLFHTAWEGRSFLAGALSSEFPVTSGHVMAESTDVMARIAAPSFPYIFFERGSQYPTKGRWAPAGAVERKHVRRRGIANTALRIKPRRILSKTRAKLRKDLPAMIERIRARIEQAWAA